MKRDTRTGSLPANVSSLRMLRQPRRSEVTTLWPKEFDLLSVCLLCILHSRKKTLLPAACFKMLRVKMPNESWKYLSLAASCWLTTASVWTHRKGEQLVTPTADTLARDPVSVTLILAIVMNAYEFKPSHLISKPNSLLPSSSSHSDWISYLVNADWAGQSLGQREYLHLNSAAVAQTLNCTKRVVAL